MKSKICYPLESRSSNVWLMEWKKLTFSSHASKSIRKSKFLMKKHEIDEVHDMLIARIRSSKNWLMKRKNLTSFSYASRSIRKSKFLLKRGEKIENLTHWFVRFWQAIDNKDVKIRRDFHLHMLWKAYVYVKSLKIHEICIKIVKFTMFVVILAIF